MRVLLALDGSPSSDAACQFVGSLTWPSGTIIQVIGVAEPAAELLAPLLVAAPTIGNIDRQMSLDLQAILDRAVRSLERPTIGVRATVLTGRPATLIVDAARDFRAELVVVGSRGRGPLASMVLGSVSAEVVDHARCAVLVVRHPAAERVLLAVDGSPSSYAAATYLATTRILTRRPVEVLSVAPASDLPGAAPLSVISDFTIDSLEARRREDREHAEGIAANAAERLRDDGYQPRWSVAVGNPAHEIIEAARCFGSGIIVMGSRGHTGLGRFLLGSVARNVLLHTPASVLIVREPTTVRAPEGAKRLEEEPAAEPAAAGAR